MLLVLHGWRWAAEAQRPLTVLAAPRPASYEFRVEMNSATWIEWSQLDGIGGTLARRIIADRESNGPFHTIEDIARVKGIGPKTLEKLRPHLYLAATPALTSE
jgi:competence protein ComEA